MYKINKLATIILLPLMIISAILSATVFDNIQIMSELLLLIFLFFLVLINKFEKEDIVLLSIFAISNLLSIYYLKPTIWMLNIKQFGLPILTLMYFKRRIDNSILLHLSFIICLLLLVIQKTIGYFPLPVSQYMVSLKDEMNGRPLGLFLNYHFSAYFVSIYLLGFSYNRKTYLIDYVIVFFFDVMTSLFSYIGQKIYTFYFRNRKPLTLTKQYFIYFISLFCFLFLLSAILDSLEIPEGARSGGLVVFYQLTDLQTYIRILHLLPNDIYAFYNQNLYDYSGTKIEGYSATGNEISFIQILVQGGLILGLTFLNFILKNISFYRIFILLSLIHYAYMFSPLIIYTMCYFANKIKKESS